MHKHTRQQQLRIALGIGAVWGVSGAICVHAGYKQARRAIAKVYDKCGRATNKMMTAVFVPLSVVILVPAGLVLARRHLISD